jgi:hypothetical protein
MGRPCSIYIISQFLWQITIYKPGKHLKQSKCWEGQKDISCCAFTFATTAAEETHIVCGQLLHPTNNDSKYEVSANWLWWNCPAKQQNVLKTLRQKKLKKGALKVQHYDAISIFGWNDRNMTLWLQQSERLNVKIKTKLGQEIGEPTSVQEYNQHMTESKRKMRFFTLTSHTGRI